MTLLGLYGNHGILEVNQIFFLEAQELLPHLLCLGLGWIHNGNEIGHRFPKTVSIAVQPKRIDALFIDNISILPCVALTNVSFSPCCLVIGFALEVES